MAYTQFHPSFISEEEKLVLLFLRLVKQKYGLIKEEDDGFVVAFIIIIIPCTLQTLSTII